MTGVVLLPPVKLGLGLEFFVTLSFVFVSPDPKTYQQQDEEEEIDRRLREFSGGLLGDRLWRIEVRLASTTVDFAAKIDETTLVAFLRGSHEILLLSEVQAGRTLVLLGSAFELRMAPLAKVA